MSSNSSSSYYYFYYYFWNEFLLPRNAEGGSLSSVQELLTPATGGLSPSVFPANDLRRLLQHLRALSLPRPTRRRKKKMGGGGWRWDKELREVDYCAEAAAANATGP